MYRKVAVLLFFLQHSYLAQAQQVEITGFSNIALGSWSGSGDLFGENSLCVYNSSVADYRVRARGGGAGYAYTLTGSGGEVTYQVRFKESSGSYVVLPSNSFQNFTNANTTNASCGGLSNADMEIRVTAAELSAAPAGSFSGSLTILLETR